MFRWQENEFLTKSDYSRNCLTFEEEEQAAAAQLSCIKLQQVEKCKLGPKVYISSGGRCTEPFVRALVNGTALVWKETALGVLGFENDILVALLASPKAKRLPQAQRVELEQTIVNWLFSCSSNEKSELVVFSTTSLYTYDDTMACRFLYSYPSEKSKKLKLLEKGRMVTLLPAALMERALRDQSLHVTCCLAPREPVLAAETMESFLLAASHIVTAAQLKQVESSFSQWAKQALIADEKESRLTEPEGMFM